MDYEALKSYVDKIQSEEDAKAPHELNDRELYRRLERHRYEDPFFMVITECLTRLMSRRIYDDQEE